jgi:hypothetical protein
MFLDNNTLSKNELYFHHELKTQKNHTLAQGDQVVVTPESINDHQQGEEEIIASQQYEKNDENLVIEIAVLNPKDPIEDGTFSIKVLTKEDFSCHHISQISLKKVKDFIKQKEGPNSKQVSGGTAYREELALYLCKSINIEQIPDVSFPEDSTYVITIS